MDVLQRMAQQVLKGRENLIYSQIPVELVGKEYQLPRGYGHAVYEIVGGHAAWHETRDATKVYGYLAENGEWVFEYVSEHCFCLAVIRLGGYNGSPDLKKLLSALLEPYRQKILKIRGKTA